MVLIKVFIIPAIHLNLMILGPSKKIIKKENFGVVIMEVKRDIEPDFKFFKIYKKLYKKKWDSINF